MFFVIILVCFFVGVYFFWQGIYLPKNAKSSEQKIFTVEKGQGVKEISQNLEKEGIIKNRIFFRLYALYSRNFLNLQAGDYQLSSSMNIPQIVEKIVRGDVFKITLTFPEGFSLKDIEQKLREAGIDGELNLANYRVGEFKNEFSFLKNVSEEMSLEGFLFPDTYHFLFGSDTIDIIKLMLNNFDKRFTPELREEIALQKKSIFEIITIASLIEKEAKAKEDKELVSGILWKRLEIGMPLQADATIVYALGEKKDKISIEDTKIDSPYNTYKYKGLPKGPICNPGLESIKAAIYPKESDYLYYLSTPLGETLFSKTLEEHNIKKEKYLR